MEGTPMKQVLIADDHAVTRRGIREILQDAFEGVQVTEVGDADAAIAQAVAQAWDLILLDVLMPGPGILQVLASIRATHATVPVLVLTGSNEMQFVVETMKAGANGLIHKHHAADDLLLAIQRVAGGGSYLHADTAAVIARTLHSPKARLPHETLSERELEVFKRIALGDAIKEIGFDLGLSNKTVATYLARIREKTGLNGHVEIARYALQHRLVD
jgi:DNA-binding NarL/FixJ family response regulator